MVTVLLSVLSVLAVAAWIATRRRLDRRKRLDDADIQQIENAGWVEVDEPLDLDEAREEEERFWNEDWDEPEPW